jgi:hypothetical protein
MYRWRKRQGAHAIAPNALIGNTRLELCSNGMKVRSA